MERPVRVRLAALVLDLADRLGRLGLGQVGAADRPQRPGDHLGLRLGQRETIENQGLVVLELGQDRHADGRADRLLGHRVAVVAVAAGERGAASLPLVSALGAGASVAGTLLAEQLLARAGDVGPAPGVDRADPAGRQVHQHHVVQQLLVDRAAEIGRVDGLLAHLLTSGIINGYG